MIEPDINEQLGSLAPSQGNADLLQNVVSQESLSMTEAITPRRSFVLPTAPPQPQLDPALKAAVDEMANQRSAVLNSSLYNATKKNPDTVAEAQRVGKQMGVGADIAERNLAELQRGAMMLKALDRNLAISAPKTANSLTEPDFANIAYDDLENLTGTEKLMNWFAGTDFFKGAQGTFISTEMATIDQLNSEGMATSKDFERYRELQRDLQIVGQPAPYSISGNIANLLASVEAGAEIGAQYAVTGAVLGGAAGAIGGPLAPATMPAGMALGGTAGFATGMAKWMYQSMAGESYRQLREGDVSHEVALPMSRGIGVITSALEFAGLGAELYIASGVGKKIFAKELATDVTAELSKQMIKKATASEAVWDASKLYFGEILTESTVEGLQTAITRVGTEIGRAYDRPDLQNMFQTPEGRRAIISEAVDSFVNVAIGMSVAGLPLPAANYYMDRGRYADAKRSQQFYEDLSKNAVDSKMRQRNPDAAERFYADQVDGTGAETTYVDGRVMQNILNQSGLTNEQVDTVLPGIRQQLAEAISIGGDVTIPTATYAARLAGTKLGDSMKIYMRPNANAWSADTAVKYAGQLEQEKEKALALLEEKETTDTAFVNEARVIEKDMQEKLAAVGRDPKLAKAEATIFRDMMVVAAAEAKMTPAAYMAEHGPDVVGPQAQQTVATLQQAQKPQVTIEGRSIPITIAIGQTGSGRELISIDTNKLDEAWLQSQNEFADSEYIGAGGTGTESTTPKKYSAFAKFQKTAKSIEGALVQIDDQGRVKFQNGRHRFAYMRDKGVTSIPVVMDAKSRANAEKFGYISAPTFLEQATTISATTYSALDKAVGDVTAKSLAASGWKEQIKGWVNKGIVKQSEVEWSGLVEYLDMQEGKITKETVSEFLKNNGVKVETVTLGDRRDMVKVAAIKGAYAAEAALGDIYGLGGTWQNQFETYRNLVRTDAPTNQIAEAAVPIDELLENEFGTDLDEYIRDAYESGGSDAKYSRYVLPGGKNYREVLVKLPVGFMPPAPALSKEGLAARQVVFDKYAPQLEALEQEISNLTYGSTGTDAEAQRLADAGNEREALETQRDAEANALYRIPNAPEVKPFISSHWDESNVLVHLRMNDRTDADGKRVLFVEEVQSDYGQEGKKKGFVSPVTQEDIDKEEKLRNETREASRNVALARSATAMEQRRILLTLGVKSYADIISAGERRKELTDAYNKLVLDDKEFAIAKENEVLAIAEEIRVNTKYNEAFEATRQNKRPFRAPFVETTDGWLNLGLKHVMLEAINGGYDRVAFVDGDQSVTRYKDALTEAVDEVEIDRNDDGTYNYKAIKDGKEVKAEESVTAERIEDLFGKSGGADLIEQADAFPDQINTIKSEDIKIGGEGMRKFYDDVLPAALNKLLKKYGGEKLQQIEIDTRVPEDNSYYETLTDDDIIRQRGFDVTDTMKERVGQGLPLFQAAPSPGPARGGYDPKRIQILLNSEADAFTFLHELMHWRMDKMIQSVNNGKASPQEIADLDIMIQSFKLGGESQQERLAIWNAMTFEEQRPHWEAIAYNFENYLFEGKAPSVEMQGVFDRMASFIKRVYVSIRDDLNKIYRREFGKDLPVLTDEVRGVMDRMLASEDQIKRKQAMMQMVPMFLTQEESGMDDATYAAYQAMNKEAEDAAVTDLTKASLKQMQWLSGARSRVLKELQAKHDALRKEIRAEVKAEVDAEPIYAAMSILKTGEGRAKNGEMVKFDDKFKLNLESVKKMIPAEDVAKLGFGKYGMVAADGMDPDMAADMFGFSSGDELVLALLSAKPAKEEINARTDKRMMDENGDMNTPQSQEEAVQRALHNEARFRFNAVEVRWLSKATSPVRVFMDAAKLAAQQIIAGKVIRDLRPSEYQAAEAKAAREAADAHNKRRTAAQAAQAAATKERNAGLSGIAAGVPMSEVEAAAAAKGQEAAQKATERESERKARYGERTPEQVILRAKQIQLLQNQLAREAQDAKDEVSKGVKYLRNVLKAKNVQRMGADIADQVTNMLERFSLANISVEEAGKRLSLAKWIEGQLELGIVPDIDPKLLDESFRKPYQQMTVSEFRDLVSSIQQLEYIGKHENEIRLAGEKVQFVDARDAIVKSIQEEKKDGKKLNPRTATTKGGRALEGIRTFMAAHLKVAAIARIMDGGKDNGKVWNYFIRSANAAGDMETRMIGEATEKVMNILKPVKALGNMEGGRVYFKSIDRSLNRGERFVIALNSGNEGNLQRMRDGEGWTMDQLAPVLESLSSTEWNAVQAIWNHFETYKPLVEAKERRLYGKAPNWIEVKPFAIKTSDGKTLNLEGGYYPIKYDPKASDAAEQFTDAETAKAQMKGAFTAATTRRSYVKNRAERVVGRPLMLTMTGVYSGLGEVIHDLSWHEWLISANRMMKDRGFSSAVNETYGPEIKRQMKDWIKDVAAGQGAADQGAANFATWMRRSISSARLGFNVTSGIMQVSGFANTWVRIDGTLVPKWTAIGVGSFVLHPKKMMSMIQEKSSMMRNLGRTQFRDLNEIRNTMQDKDGKWNAIHANAYIFCKVMQSMVNYPTWAGAYEKALFEGNNEDTSIALADQAVIDSQGGGQLKDLASVERGGAWSKLFTVFYGYQNALFNSMATSVMTQKKSTAAAQLTLLVAVPAVYKYYVNQAVKAKRKDNDDDEEKGLAAFVAEESIQTMLGSMIGIRELGNLAKFDSKDVRDYSGPSGLAMMTDIYNVTIQARQNEWDAAYRRALLNLAGDLFGIPAVQINRTIDGIQLMIDKNNADLRAPIFGTRR